MDAMDRKVINSLQGDFPVCERPFAAVAEQLGITEDECIARIGDMLWTGTLSRFGPMFDAERMGGAFTLAAMTVPEKDFDRIADIVNKFPQVAHNYEREHKLNMWFVLAAEAPEDIPRIIARIESQTGLKVYDFPRLREFHIGLRLDL